MPMSSTNGPVTSRITVVSTPEQTAQRFNQ